VETPIRMALKISWSYPRSHNPVAKLSSLHNLYQLPMNNHLRGELRRREHRSKLCAKGVAEDTVHRAI
jgi:hypothetical protein